MTIICTHEHLPQTFSVKEEFTCRHQNAGLELLRCARDTCDRIQVGLKWAGYAYNNIETVSKEKLLHNCFEHFQNSSDKTAHLCD